MKRRLLIVLLAIVASLCLAFGIAGCFSFGSISGSDSDDDSSGLKYALIDDGTAYEVTYSGTGATEIVIPEEYNGLPVTSIGSQAFFGCTSLKSITIPDSVTSIGSSAFYYCTSLTSVTIGSGVTSIGSFAFEDCTSLTSVVVPDSVTSIGQSAFYGCTSLESVTIGNDVTSIGIYAFRECTALTEIYYNATACEDLSNSNGVFYNAGKNSDGITVTIGANVEKIPAYLFYGSSTNIVRVVFAENSQCTSIGDFAFYYCTSLTSVTIGNSVTSIGIQAFAYCTSLTEIYYNATACEDSSSDDRVFSFAGQNSDGIMVTIGANVTKIPAYLFYPYYFSYAPNIISVVFEEESVCTSIGNYAFYNCTSLMSITIPDSVTSIGSSAFSGCTSLTSITIPDSVTSIGSSAFSGCTSLTSITIPDSVTEIGEGAFYNCTSLTDLYYNATACNNLSSNNYVFYNAGQNGDGITVTIGANVEKIPANLFYSYSYAPNIVSVVFADGSQCTSIGDSAFYNCTSLTSITIPDSATSIGRYAFYNCTSLTEIYYNATACEDLSSSNYVFYNAGKNGDGITVTIGANVEKIPAYLFCPRSSSSYSPNIVSIVFEEGSQCTSIGNYAFAYCASITSITIPESVTEIDNYAFSGCTALTEIYYNATTCNDLSSRNYVFYNAGKNGNGITVTIGANVEKIPAYLFYPYDYYASSSTSYAPNIVSVIFEEGSQCTSIGESAFVGCTLLESITIPNSVTSIGSQAFYGCTSLTSVTIPNSVTSIGYYAFSGCTSLTSVTIGNSVTSIGEYAFYNCTSLESVTIGSGVTSIGDYAFSGCSNLKYNTYDNAYYLGNDENPYYVLISATDAEITSCKIHEDAKLIVSRAFYYCRLLTSITIPDSVTSIGSYAFQYCSSLTSVTIGSSVTSIGSYAFYGCTSLKSVTIGSSVTSIGDYAFYYCSRLTSITIPDSVTSIGNYAFSGCTALTSITIPDSVISIGSRAFSGCTALTSITIPDSVTSIGSRAFSGCTSLAEIIINDDNEYYCSIDGVLFSKDKTELIAYPAGKTDTSYTIPDGVTSIGNYAFYNCTSLTSITIPDSVTSIGDYAFSGCTSLESVTIGSGVTSIGNSAFSSCTSLESVTIGSGVTSIGSSAFSGCTSLTSITIPDSVTSIGDYAFSGCTSLESVTIGNSVTSIGNYAFYGCTSLTSIVIPDSVTSIGGYAFRNCTSLESVTIGSGVTSIGERAFYNCTSLESVIIGSGVTIIGYRSFYGCSSLTTVYYGGDEEEWSGISISLGNDTLSSATVYYYSENEPTASGNYWHYVDGVATAW